MLSNVFSLYMVVLVTQALCAYAAAGARPMYHAPTKVIREDDGWALLRRNMNEMLTTRQAPQPPSNNTNPDGTNGLELDMVAWDTQTTQRCVDKLRNATMASNPAGIAVCYNIPVFNKANWFFVAELRLYKVSQPASNWSQIGNDIGVGLDYRAAEVEKTNLGVRNTTAPEGPPLVGTFHFLGMVQQDFRKEGATDDEIRQLLVPRIIIRGEGSDGLKLETSVSTDEASFVNGMFTVTNQQQTNTQTSPSSVPPPAKFELPGKKIEIMPIGLIFFSVYMVVGVSIVMFGTFERWKFREQYRRRVASSVPGGARI